MLGLQNVVRAKVPPQSNTPSTRSDTTSSDEQQPLDQQPPRTALGVPTNSAVQGPPPVKTVMDKIMNMSKPDRMLLAARLAKAGF